MVCSIVLVVMGVCNKIQISGATYQQSLEGTYVLFTEQGCGGKPSWRQESGDNFIYEHDDYTREMTDQWVVGSEYCSGSVG